MYIVFDAVADASNDTEQSLLSNFGNGGNTLSSSQTPYIPVLTGIGCVGLLVIGYMISRKRHK